MKAELMDKMVEWLAGECRGAGDDLDSLECAVVDRLRGLGQRALQRLAEEKKGATRDPREPANVGDGLDSSDTGRRRC